MPKAKVKNPQHGAQSSSVPKPGCIRVEVEFVLERCRAEQVYICGDFNDWQPASLRMVGNPKSGLWEKRLTLEPGRYEYKFCVDGNWIHDPVALENVPNPYGSLNSVVDVEPESTPVL
jgi:1,4-alpha-glucan branching enzyme